MENIFNQYQNSLSSSSWYKEDEKVVDYTITFALMKCLVFSNNTRKILTGCWFNVKICLGATSMPNSNPNAVECVPSVPYRTRTL